MPGPFRGAANLCGSVSCRGQPFPCAVTHFKGPQIFVAHFNYVCDVKMTKLLGLGSELMAAEVISKNKKVTASQCRGWPVGGRNRSLFAKKNKVIAPPIHGCWSVWLFICTSISQPHSTCEPIIKVGKHPWPTRLTCHAHRLRTSKLEPLTPNHLLLQKHHLLCFLRYLIKGVVTLIAEGDKCNI